MTLLDELAAPDPLTRSQVANAACKCSSNSVMKHQRAARGTAGGTFDGD